MTIFRTMASILIGATLLLAQALPAGELAPRPRVDTPRIDVLDCGTITNDRPEHNGVTRNEVKYSDFANMCYLIVHPKGPLLWDTGLPDRMVGEPLYENMFFFFGFLKMNTLVGQLADLGYRSADIGNLSFSHLHIDQSGNGNLFAKSNWLVAKPEYDAAFSPAPGTQVFGLENFDGLKAAQKVWTGPDHDVFGDGSVIIKQNFGHSPGHSVLAVRLKRTGLVVLGGDLYHYPEKRKLSRIGELDVRTATPQARASLERWLTRERGQLWIAHDMELFRTLRHSPAYYD